MTTVRMCQSVLFYFIIFFFTDHELGEGLFAKRDFTKGETILPVLGCFVAKDFTEMPQHRYDPLPPTQLLTHVFRWFAMQCPAFGNELAYLCDADQFAMKINDYRDLAVIFSSVSCSNTYTSSRSRIAKPG